MIKKNFFFLWGIGFGEWFYKECKISLVFKYIIGGKFLISKDEISNISYIIGFYFWKIIKYYFL